MFPNAKFVDGASRPIEKIKSSSSEKNSRSEFRVSSVDSCIARLFWRYIRNDFFVSIRESNAFAEDLFIVARKYPLAAPMKAALFNFVGSIFAAVSKFVWMYRSG